MLIYLEIYINPSTFFIICRAQQVEFATLCTYGWVILHVLNLQWRAEVEAGSQEAGDESMRCRPRGRRAEKSRSQRTEARHHADS
jgi:hypothetical protein